MVIQAKQFSCSSRKEDDEVLRWDVLEKLPTYDYDLIHLSIIQAVVRTDRAQAIGSKG